MLYAVEQVRRRAHAHQIVRPPRRWQMRRDGRQYRLHFGLRLAHREAADGVAVEAHVHQRGQALAAQVVMHAALDDAEQEARVIAVAHPPAPGPGHRPAHGGGRLVASGRIRGTFVEGHHRVRADVVLYLDRALRRQLDAAAVEGRAEHHAGVRHPPPLAQAEHLVAAGIREDRAVPAHEAVQAAEGRQRRIARPLKQVEGIAEQHLGAGLPKCLRRHALHRAVGAARHERWGLNGAVGGRQLAAAGGAVGGQHLEGLIRRARRTWRRRSCRSGSPRLPQPDRRGARRRSRRRQTPASAAWTPAGGSWSPAH